MTITGKEILAVAGLVAVFAMLNKQKGSVPAATPGRGVTPTSPAPVAYTALAAPSLYGDAGVLMIGSGAGGGVGFAGAAVGGTYAGRGQSVGQGYGLTSDAIPNMYGWQGSSPAAYKAVGR